MFAFLDEDYLCSVPLPVGMMGRVNVNIGSKFLHIGLDMGVRMDMAQGREQAQWISCRIQFSLAALRPATYGYSMQMVEAIC